MRIYIAAKYGKRFELRALDARLKAMGHTTTSQWVWNAEESKDSPRAAAEMDVDDVCRADVILYFAEPRGSLNSGGGRHFELGLAWAKGKRCLVVGEYEHVFLHLKEVEMFASVDEAITALADVG